jgi:beta-lactamase class C
MTRITVAQQIFWSTMQTILAMAAMFVTGLSGTCAAMSDIELEWLITREIAPMVDDVAGAAIAVRMDGRTTFLNYGMAERANKRPVTSDTLFNIASIRKVFEATLLAEAVNLGELAFADRVADYVPELRQGEYISRVTLGQLASHTSGLLLPTDHPPWPDYHYSLSHFLRDLNAWTPSEGQEPGKQHTYSHAGYVLLQLALERRFATPIGQLLEQRIFKPLRLLSTSIPATGVNGRAQLEPAFMARAVQGYSVDGNPIGAPGDQQGFFDFAGTGQIFSSARERLLTLMSRSYPPDNSGKLTIAPYGRDAKSSPAEQPIDKRCGCASAGCLPGIEPVRLPRSVLYGMSWFEKLD